MTRIPKSMDVHINQLMQLIGSVKPPVWIPAIPSFRASLDNCFYNVENQKKEAGGDIVYGWKIHRSMIIMEAERHAVWKSEEGNLLDITPDKFKRPQTLFLEDENEWEFTGQLTDNVRINIANNPLVDDYILLAQTITRLWNTGKRVSQSEVRLPERVGQLINILENDLLSRENWIMTGAARNDRCYCGKPVKYLDCHGYNLDEQFREVIAWATDINVFPNNFAR